MTDHNLAPLRAVPLPDRLLEAALPEDVYMEHILHKLQLLHYEREFCRKKRPHRKALSVNYFAGLQAGSAGNEQFFYFTSLAAWLLQMCGQSVPWPKEFDDPNTTLQGLLQGLSALGFASPSYPLSKLGQGWGKEVCALLDGLLDATFQRKGIVLGRPSYSLDRPDDAEVVEGNVEDDDDHADIGAQVEALTTEESEQDAAVALTAGSDFRPAGQQQQARDIASSKQVLTSTVDAMQWKLEVERVAPKLRIAAAADMQDWRRHLESAHGYVDALTTSWPDARAGLDKLATELSASLEKLNSREQQLHSQFAGLMMQYQDTRQQLITAQEDFNRRIELTSAGNNELHRLAAALEDAKQALDSKGSTLSDASPLIKLKAAIASLKTELRQMELRIGVVAHNLMGLSRKDKQMALQKAAKTHLDTARTY
eukprot:gene8504-8686_t